MQQHNCELTKSWEKPTIRKIEKKEAIKLIQKSCQPEKGDECLLLSLEGCEGQPLNHSSMACHAKNPQECFLFESKKRK
jgi:hypothetical protein